MVTFTIYFTILVAFGLYWRFIGNFSRPSPDSNAGVLRPNTRTSGRRRLSKRKFFCAVKMPWLKFCAKICVKNDIKHVKQEKTLSNCDIYMKLVPFFPVTCLSVKTLCKFSKILRNHVIAWLQFLETLVRSTWPVEQAGIRTGMQKEPESGGSGLLKQLLWKILLWPSGW